MTSFWLTNVTLESGFNFAEDFVESTQTTKSSLLIRDGRIAEIHDGNKPTHTTELPTYDAKGLLLLPSLYDFHAHLDKTYYGGPWKACRPASGVKDRLKEEATLLPQLLPHTRERAEAIFDLILSHGTTRVRGHCNVDPHIGLKNLEQVLLAIENYHDKIDCSELVAFPQHSLYRSQMRDTLSQALSMGANFIGGIDPANIEGNIDASLDLIFELAVQHNAGVDIHLHDGNSLGIFEMHRIADYTEQAGWQNRVTISHAFALADVLETQARETATRLASLGISLASTVPLGRTIPIPLLDSCGVKVGLGTDSFTDHWSPFGNGDILEKAGRLAERFGISTEAGLAHTLNFATGGITPLDAHGQRQWPHPNAEANMILVQASCSAEAVARRAPRHTVFFKGKQVAGTPL